MYTPKRELACKYLDVYWKPDSDSDGLICICRSSSRLGRCGSQILPLKQPRPLRT